MGLDNVLHFHGFDYAQLLAINNCLASLNLKGYDWSRHGRHNHLRGIDLHWDCHMMLVLILSLVEDSSFNIIALIVEVKVQVVLGTSELEFSARFPTVHFNKRIVLKGKVFHLNNLRCIMGGQVCHNVSMVVGVFHFPVWILMLSLACNCYVEHLLFFGRLTIYECVFGDSIVFHFKCGESECLVIFWRQWDPWITFRVEGWDEGSWVVSLDEGFVHNYWFAEADVMCNSLDNILIKFGI